MPHTCQVLFKVALAMFTLSAPEFEAVADEYGEFFNALGRTPATMLDADTLMKLRLGAFFPQQIYHSLFFFVWQDH